MIAYFSLTLAFVILGALLLLIMINVRFRNLAMFLLIPFVIWFGLVLYFIPSRIAGWPTDGEPPSKSIILSSYVIEPGSITDGGIYFWVIYYEEIKRSLSPWEFIELISEEPRCYKVPYDRELHRKLLKAEEDAEKTGNLLEFDRDDPAKFGLIDPRELLPKGVTPEEVIPDDQRDSI